MVVAIVAGGGGHTGFAVSLAQRMAGRVELFFIVPEGDRWSIERVSRFGRYAEVVKPRGPRDTLARALPGFVKAFFQSMRIIGKGFSVLVSTGSNHSVMPGLTAWLKRIPLLNVEDVIRLAGPSRSARLLSRFARLTVLQWEEQRKFYPNGVYVGPIYEKPAYEPRDDGYVLVAGGTWGHRALLEAAARSGVDNIVLQTGRVSPEPYRKRGFMAFDFDPDFGKWVAGASVVVTHLGKTAVDVALGYGKPVVIAPNPEWRLTGTPLDAELLAGKLNAVFLPRVTPEGFRRAVREASGRTPPRYEDGAARLAELLISMDSGTGHNVLRPV